MAKVPDSAIVTVPWALGVVVSVKLEPEPVTITAEPLVTAKSAAVIDDASSDSFALSVNWIAELFDGSACPAA